jgi:flagellar hook-associated protein 2
MAELNETGDGIRIRDLADGNGTLTVSDMDSTAAADLHIAGEAVPVTLDGELAQAIDGSSTYTIHLDAGDSLTDLRDKINQLGAGLTATLLTDGSSRPYRLSLVSTQPGSRGQVVLDASGLDLSFHQAVRGQDALLMFGDAAAGSSLLVSSTSNKFEGVVPDVTLEIHEASATPVTVSVSTTDEDFVAGVTDLVDRYNKFRNKLTELTRYEPESDTRSILTGDGAALRLDSDLSYLLSGRFFGAGSIRSLAEVGIEIAKDGTLQVDPSRLQAKFESDPEALREFFTNEEFGFSAKLGKLIDQLAEDESSLLGQRISSLNAKIQRNEERLTFMTERLNAQRERLLMDFYRLETAIGKMQTNLTALASIQVLPPLTSTRADT